MNTRRTYRQWDRPDCPISILHFKSRRVMELFSPHLHDELELIYIVRGDYEMYSPDGNCKVSTGTVYTVLPNEIHSIRSLCDDGEYMSLAIGSMAVAMEQEHFFQRDFAEPLQSGRLQLPRVLRAADPDNGELFEYFDKLLNLDKNNPMYVSKRFAYTMGICTELMSRCLIIDNKSENAHAESDVAKECVKYLHEHYAQKISLFVLAEHVHVHPNYLCAAFKKDVGLTVLEYLSRIRVEEARRLLGRSGMSISQVAEQCGFRSISAFQRTFKAHTGTTPSKFAKLYKQ